jgi:hypothetical protein
MMHQILRNIYIFILAVGLNSCVNFSDPKDFLGLIENQGELTPAQIAKKRYEISLLEDETHKRLEYGTLQYRTPYYNQLANFGVEEISCSITSLSMGLAYLGIDLKPDVLIQEVKRENKGVFNAEESVIRKKIVENHGVSYEFYPTNNKNNIEIAFEIIKHLGEGKAILVSYGGHIVQAIDMPSVIGENKEYINLIVNDPYGQMNFTEREKWNSTNKNILKHLIKESKKRPLNELEKTKLSAIDGNGYSCLPNKQFKAKCDALRKNNYNANSKVRKQNIWKVSEMKEKIRYYEVYSKNQEDEYFEEEGGKYDEEY